MKYSVPRYYWMDLIPYFFASDSRGSCYLCAHFPSSSGSGSISQSKQDSQQKQSGECTLKWSLKTFQKCFFSKPANKQIPHSLWIMKWILKVQGSLRKRIFFLKSKIVWGLSRTAWWLNPCFATAKIPYWCQFVSWLLQFHSPPWLWVGWQ